MKNNFKSKIQKKILFINNYEQFGYHIDIFKYEKYLFNKYDMTFFSWDYNLKKKTNHNSKVDYFDAPNSFLLKIFIVLKYIYKNSNDYDIYFIRYFPMCSLINLFCKKNIILDIRTSHTTNNPIIRYIYNKLISIESKFFKNVSIISKKLAKKLNVNTKLILPLGADTISNKSKSFDNINLIYVGTFNNRNINETILGYVKFYNEFNSKFNISYDIIGSGSKDENQIIDNLINQYSSHNINYRGYLSHDELKIYFDNANIGVSYIPINDIFDYQPPTKTYEYLLSGMCVLATKTYENKKVITSENGILINDNSEDFYSGLVSYVKNNKKFNSNKIITNSLNYSWENVVRDKLDKILKKLKV